MSRDISGSYLRSGRNRRAHRNGQESPLFSGVKAWFSASVNNTKKLTWKRNGGSFSDWRDAHFLFSEDIESQDTRCLFEQMEFLWGYVTVFHASFITDCIRKDLEGVTIAPYLLIPSDFPSVKTKYISDSDDDNIGFVEPEEPRQMQRRLGRTNTLDKPTLDDKKQRSSNGQPCGSCSTQYQFCNGVEEINSDCSRSLPDLESIPHIDTLKKTNMPMVDFVPNQNGCKFFRKC